MPIHITGFWRISLSNQPERSGSVGAGLNIGPRVIGEALKSPYTPPKITLNGLPLNTCMTDTLLNFLGRNVSGEIRIYSPVPLGVGYAVSAAISLIVSYGLYYLGGRGVEDIEPAVDAHKAEVRCRTGLGDVIAQYYGGSLEVRVRPGAPGYGEIIKIPIDGLYRVLTVPLEKKLDTPTMLSKYADVINRYGEIAIKRLLENPSLETFLRLARKFSYSVGMVNVLGEKLRIIESLFEDKILDGFYVKKNVLVTVVKEPNINIAFQTIYKAFKGMVFEGWFEDTGIRIEKI